MTQVMVELDGPGAARHVAAEVLERLRVLIVAGVAVGVLVAGVGSRLAMYVLRVTSSDSVRGVESDDGFTIGQFTLGGSYNLLVLGAAVGIVGAATYRAVSPWLLGPSWFRRFTIASAAGAVVGSMLVHADGIDFHVLGPLWLAIGLFVALPALFAVAMGVAVDRVAAADSWTVVGRRRWLLPLVLVIAFPSALFVSVPALVVLTVWIPVRRRLPDPGRTPWIARLSIRGAWLTVAILGLIALVGDVQDLV